MTVRNSLSRKDKGNIRVYLMKTPEMLRLDATVLASSRIGLGLEH